MNKEGMCHVDGCESPIGERTDCKLYRNCVRHQKIANDAYDAHVDPLGFYRSKSIENFD